MTHLHDLHLRNAEAPSVLDWLCSVETMREILEAITPGQLVVCALLWDGMTLKEIGDALGVSYQAVQSRRDSAQERVVRTLYHAGENGVAGDALSRSGRELRPKTGSCIDCGIPIRSTSTRCRSCACVENERRKREAMP